MHAETEYHLHFNYKIFYQFVVVIFADFVVHIDCTLLQPEDARMIALLTYTGMRRNEVLGCVGKILTLTNG